MPIIRVSLHNSPNLPSHVRACRGFWTPVVADARALAIARGVARTGTGLRSASRVCLWGGKNSPDTPQLHSLPHSLLKVLSLPHSLRRRLSPTFPRLLFGRENDSLTAAGNRRLRCGVTTPKGDELTSFRSVFRIAMGVKGNRFAAQSALDTHRYTRDTSRMR